MLPQVHTRTARPSITPAHRTTLEDTSMAGYKDLGCTYRFSWSPQMFCLIDPYPSKVRFQSAVY